MYGIKGGQDVHLLISVLACHPPFSVIEPANLKGGLEVISRQLKSAKGTNGR